MKDLLYSLTLTEFIRTQSRLDASLSRILVLQLLISNQRPNIFLEIDLKRFKTPMLFLKRSECSSFPVGVQGAPGQNFSGAKARFEHLTPVSAPVSV